MFFPDCQAVRGFSAISQFFELIYSFLWTNGNYYAILIPSELTFYSFCLLPHLFLSSFSPSPASRRHSFRCAVCVFVKSLAEFARSAQSNQIVFAAGLPRQKLPEAKRSRALAPTNRGKAEGDGARVSLQKRSLPHGRDLFWFNRIE